MQTLVRNNDFYSFNCMNQIERVMRRHYLIQKKVMQIVENIQLKAKEFSRDGN